MIIRLLRNVCIPPHPTIHYFLLLKIFKSHYRSKKIFICWLFCSIAVNSNLNVTLFDSLRTSLEERLQREQSSGMLNLNDTAVGSKQLTFTLKKVSMMMETYPSCHQSADWGFIPLIWSLLMFHIKHQRNASWRMLNRFEFVTAIYSSVFTSRSLVEWRLWCGKIGSDSFPAQISADSQQRLKNGFSPWFSVLWPLTRLFNSHTPPVCRTHHSGRSLSCFVGLLNGPENILVTG